VRAMTLDEVPDRALFGAKVQLTGWLRGLGRARLQVQNQGAGWTTIRAVRAAPSGRFAVTVPAMRSTQYRLAYNGLAGDDVTLQVAPRVTLRADGTKLRVLVTPRLPLRVERLTKSEWRPVARSTGTFARSLRPGSYRVEIAGGTSYASAVSKPIALRS